MQYIIKQWKIINIESSPTQTSRIETITKSHQTFWWRFVVHQNIFVTCHILGTSTVKIPRICSIGSLAYKGNKMLELTLFGLYISRVITEINFSSMSEFLKIPWKIRLLIIIFQKVHQGNTLRSNVTFYTTKMTNRNKNLTFYFLPIIFHKFTCYNRLLYNKLAFFCNRFHNRLIIWDINRISKQTRFNKHSLITDNSSL